MTLSPRPPGGSSRFEILQHTADVRLIFRTVIDRVARPAKMVLDRSLVVSAKHGPPRFGPSGIGCSRRWYWSFPVPNLCAQDTLVRLEVSILKAASEVAGDRSEVVG